jgi:hypothetical protein
MREKRRSLLSGLPVPKNEGPQTQTNQICIWCTRTVFPQFCYTGSVLDKLRFSKVKGTERTPVLGVMETHERAYILGGDMISTTKSVGYYKRIKGLICSDCAGEYRGITDKGGTFHPYVKTDPLRPSGQTLIPEKENIPTETKSGMPLLSSGNPSQRVTLLDREEQSTLMPRMRDEIIRENNWRPETHWLNVGRRSLR